MSDWYFDDAMKILEKAREKKNVARRRAVLAAMRQLISYLANRSAPRPPNAINTEDGPICDQCFGRTLHGLEFCRRCERGAKRKNRKAEVNLERNGSLSRHELRVHAELERLGFAEKQQEA